MAAKTGTYTLIASNTLSAITTDITFSSIPATYTDLVIVVNYKAYNGAKYLSMRLNGDTASNYSRTELRGDGTSATSQRVANEAYAYLTSIYAPTGELGTFIINLNDYSNTTTFKTILTRGNNAGAGGTGVNVNLWRSTAAINTVFLTALGSGYDIGSTFKLYGIEAAK
jgi:hypothetical protein